MPELDPNARKKNKTAEIVRCFAEGLSIKDASDRVGMDKRTIGPKFIAIRSKLDPHIERLCADLRASDAWKLGAKKIHILLMLARVGESAGAFTISEKNVISIKPEFDNGLLRQHKEQMEDEESELYRAMELFSNGSIDTAMREYINYSYVKKRGLGDSKDTVLKEFQYRFHVYFVTRALETPDTEHPKQSFPDGTKRIVQVRPDYDKLFAPTEKEAQIIEQDLVSILRDTPIS